MKTTENISLAGYSFTIETDAYEELGAYLQDLREAFKSDDNAEEITSDIEERIAELLREKCVSGMAVNLKMISEIKQRLGKPKEMVQDDNVPANEDCSTKTEKAKKSWKTKRLYRNVDEKVLGGVCSGLGTYLGLDKALIRIAFAIIFFITFVRMTDGGDGPAIIFPVLAYICLWVAMPAARTAEQKREMKGRPTDLEGYRSKDFDLKTEIDEAVQSPVGQTARRAGGIFLGILLLVAGLGGILTCVIIPSLPSIILHEVTEEVAKFGPLGPEESFLFNMVSNFNTTWILVLVNIGLIAVWIIYCATLLIFDLKAPSWRPGLILFLAWIISIFVIIAYFIEMLAEAFPTFVLNI